MAKEIQEAVQEHAPKMYPTLGLQFVNVGNTWKNGTLACISAARNHLAKDFLVCCGDHIFHPNTVIRIAHIGRFIHYDACVLAENDLEGMVGLPKSTNLLASSALKYGKNHVTAFGPDLQTYSALECGLFSCRKDSFFQLLDEMQVTTTYHRMGLVFEEIANRGRLCMEFTDGYTWFAIETKAELDYARDHITAIVGQAARPAVLGGVEVTISGLPNKFASPHSGEWEEFSVEQWRSALYRGKTYFKELTKETTEFIRTYLKYMRGTSEELVVVEVGCGTGECLAELVNDVEYAVGVDINPKFIDFCQTNTPKQYRDKMSYVVGDAKDLTAILEECITERYQNAHKLVCCLGNTIGIMPSQVKASVYREMINVVGSEGIAVMVYWNGNWFGDAIQNFYLRNPQLCGSFTGANVDFSNLTLETSTGYKTHWTTPEEATMVVKGFDWNPLEVREKGKGVLVAGQLAKRVHFSKEEHAAQSY